MEQKKYLSPDNWHDPLVNPEGHPVDEENPSKIEGTDWYNTASPEQKPKEEDED